MTCVLESELSFHRTRPHVLQHCPGQCSVVHSPEGVATSSSALVGIGAFLSVGNAAQKLSAKSKHVVMRSPGGSFVFNESPQARSSCACVRLRAPSRLAPRRSLRSKRVRAR